MRAFLQSVFIGALAASWFPLIVTICLFLSSIPYYDDPGLDGEGSLLIGVVGALSPLLATMVIVFFASLVIGLPVTFLLEKFQKESVEAYVGIGSVAGFLLTLFSLQLKSEQELVWMTLLGAFSGGMTARTWWTLAREDKASYVHRSWDD